MEKMIQELVAKKMEEGIVEKVLSEQLEKAITNSIESLFRWGDASKLVETKIKEVILPYVEAYDFEAFLPKLDILLTEIVKQYQMPEYKKMVNNFKTVLTVPEDKIVDIEVLAKHYSEYIARTADVSGREVEYDDEPVYEAFEYSVCFTQDEERSYSDWDYGHISFVCDEEESLCHCLELFKPKDQEHWFIRGSTTEELKLNELSTIDNFKLALVKYSASNCKIFISDDAINDCVYSETKPEASYS